LFKDGKRVLIRTFQRSSITADRSTAFHLMETNEWDTCYIKVTYPLGEDYYNDGTYTDIKTAKRVLGSFTEAELIREMK
jgi:hypothetical protein